MYKIFVPFFLLMLVSACTSKDPDYWKRQCYVGDRVISTTIWSEGRWGREPITRGLECALCVCTWERISSEDAAIEQERAAND